MPDQVRTERRDRRTAQWSGESLFQRPARPPVAAEEPAGGAAEGPSYYDVSILKPPVWKWEISNYFFWGGISAGAYILARLADRLGGERCRDIARTGTLTSFLTALPCAPLLISDLGDPGRFHHMLRVWKPTSPMNLGTWSLTAYSGMVTAAVLREYLRGRHSAEKRSALSRMTNATLLALHDAAGIPLALLVAGYTGVLLSCTANPLWCRNEWLGPLFSASAISTGAEAISLVTSVRGRSNPVAERILDRVDTLGHAVELVALRGFIRRAGEGAAPLTRGRMKKHLLMSIGGILAAEMLKLLPAPKPVKPIVRLLSAGIGLASGFSLRWGIVHGGRPAAEDPRIARLATGSQEPDARKPAGKLKSGKVPMRPK